MAMWSFGVTAMLRVTIPCHSIDILIWFSHTICLCSLQQIPCVLILVIYYLSQCTGSISGYYKKNRLTKRRGKAKFGRQCFARLNIVTLTLAVINCFILPSIEPAILKNYWAYSIYTPWPVYDVWSSLPSLTFINSTTEHVRKQCWQIDLTGECITESAIVNSKQSFLLTAHSLLSKLEGWIVVRCDFLMCGNCLTHVWRN